MEMGVDTTSMLMRLLPPVFAVLIPVVVLWSGVLFWAVRWLLNRFARNIDARFTEVGASIAGLKDTQHVADRQVMELKVELAKEYVRREDWIRGWSVVDAKLDAVWTKIDKLQERVHTGRELKYE